MDDKSIQEVSVVKNNVVEVNKENGLGLFPIVKYPVELKEESKDTIFELMRNLAFISNLEGPLRMELPMPAAMSEDKSLEELRVTKQSSC
jgi:hypothetical protein